MTKPKQKHTAEPWVCQEPDNLGIFEVVHPVENGDWQYVATIGGDDAPGPQNGARLVACVNALAGVEDPEKAVKDLLEVAQLAADASLNWTGEDEEKHPKLKRLRTLAYLALALFPKEAKLRPSRASKAPLAPGHELHEDADGFFCVCFETKNVEHQYEDGEYAKCGGCNKKLRLLRPKEAKP